MKSSFSLFGWLLVFPFSLLLAQTPQDAALINAADQMNFIDWYRNATNGTYGQGTSGYSSNNQIPESFFDGVPYYAIEDYAYFQGDYYGRTLNRLSNRYGDTWLTLGNIDYDQGTICVKAGWSNGLVGDVHLEAPLTETNILTGEGLLYYNGQAVYDIYMFLFLLNDGYTLKGACVLNPRTRDGVVQSSTFVLKR